MISRIESFGLPVNDGAGTRATETGSEFFKQALSQAMSRTDTADTAVSRAEENGTALGEIVSTGRSALFADTGSGIRESTADLLDKLADYSSLLGDSSRSLKQLAPAIEEINRSAGLLLQDAESGRETDPGLLSLARESAIMASNEYIRFQRGDYL